MKRLRNLFSALCLALSIAAYGSTGDVTSAVGTGTSSWTGTSGSYGLVVTTGAGESVNMVEHYTRTTNQTTGKIIYQTVTNLTNGFYTVELYANACSTKSLRDTGIAGEEAADGAEDVAYVYAGDQQTAVPVKVALEVTEETNGVYVLSNVKVTDGTLEIGLAKSAGGTNWHTVQIKSLTINTEPYTFINTEWISIDANRVGTDSITYNSDNSITVTGSTTYEDGNNNISLSLKSDRSLCKLGTDKYFYIKAKDISTESAKSYLWYTNNVLTGNVVPTLITQDDEGYVYLAWDLTKTTTNTGLTTSDIVALSTTGTYNMVFGLTSTNEDGISTVYDIDFISEEELPEAFQVTIGKERLAALISAVTTINGTINSSSLTTDIATAQAVYDNAEATSTDIDNAYAALRAAAIAELPNATDAIDVSELFIENHSFEYGYLYPWETTLGGDTGVKTYKTNGQDGTYIFNTYNVSDFSINQTATDLPSGAYSLSALVASDSGNTVTINAGSNTTVRTTTDGGRFNFVETDKFTVSDGTLNIGATSSTWYRADDFTLTYYPAVITTNLKQAIADATAIGGLDSQIATAQAALDAASSQESVDNATTALLNAIKAALAPEFTGNALADGEFYLYNVAKGEFLVGSNSWGTQASLDDVGVLTNLTNIGTNIYKISTNSLYTNKYLGTDGYMDNGTQGDWEINPVEGMTNVYTLSVLGKNLTWVGDTTTVTLQDNSSINGYWMLVSYSDREAKLSEASKTNPVNASFHINNPDLSFGVSVNNWTTTGTVATLVNKNNHDLNDLREIWNNTGTMSQEITGLQTGLYRVRCIGFYRDGEEPRNYYATNSAFRRHHRGYEKLIPELYANDQSTAIESIFDEGNSLNIGKDMWVGTGAGSNEFQFMPMIPFSKGEVSHYFNAKLYNDNITYVNVTDGNLTIGVRKDTIDDSGDWFCFDHFRLEYLGAADAEYAEALNHFTEIRQAAEQFYNNEFELRSDRDSNYVDGGTYTYLTEVKTLHDAAVANVAAATDAATINTISDNLEIATRAGWLKLQLAEFHDYYKMALKLEQTAYKQVAEAVSAHTAYEAATSVATTTFEGAEAVAAAANDLAAVENAIVALSALEVSLPQAAVDFAAVADPADSTEFDLSLLLMRPDLTGIELWCEPQAYGWRTDVNLNSDGSAQYNFNIHSGNNTYKGANAYFAERWTPVDLDLANGWVIYQKIKLPKGMFRFSAGSFASDGNEDNPKPAEDAYLAVGDNKNRIITEFLSDNTIAFELDETAAADSVNIGIIADGTGTKANWAGMGYMKLYKIPQVEIRQDITYEDHRDPYSGAQNDSEYLFNISEQAKVTMYREFTLDTWSTLCVPCDMNSEDIKNTFGPNAVVNKFTGSQVTLFQDGEMDNAIADLYFEASDSIKANEPCLIWISSEDAASLPTTDWIFDMASARIRKINQYPSLNPDNGPFTFVGVYDGTGWNGTYGNNDDNDGFAIPRPTETTSSYYLTKIGDETRLRYMPSVEDQLAATGSTADQLMRGLRGYFQYDSEVTGVSAKKLVFNVSNSIANDIKAVETNYQNAQKAQNGIYNMNGQKVSNGSDVDNLSRGVYIVNGKKVIVK